MKKQTVRPATLLPAVALLALAGATLAQPPAAGPVKVTVKDQQTVVVEPEAPIDPVKRIQYRPNGMSVQVNSETGGTLHLSHFPTVNVDGRLYQQFGENGQPEFLNRPLPKGKGLRTREGFVSAFKFGDVRITTTVTLVPTKPSARGAKRRMDAVMVHYLIENKGQQAHKVGLRVYMDTYVISNDGCLFAAPTIPNQILDARVLKDKELPPYLQMLQQPNLQNPGFVSHLTLDLGSKLEKPERLVLTRHGSGFNTWDMPANNAGGDSAIGVFWEPKEIKPGGKREFAYGYGQGIATSPESEGRVDLSLGGSFEPGKLFSVTARITDPAQGQYLTLELPEGMALAEGKTTQPVPEAQGDEPYSLVLWRGRVLRTGEHTLRVRSSTGVTLGKQITVTPAGG
jgi:hypothetical protein